MGKVTAVSNHDLELISFSFFVHKLEPASSVCTVSTLYVCQHLCHDTEQPSWCTHTHIYNIHIYARTPRCVVMCTLPQQL